MNKRFIITNSCILDCRGCIMTKFDFVNHILQVTTILVTYILHPLNVINKCLPCSNLSANDMMCKYC